MRVTVNEVSSYLCTILTPIIVKTYLQAGEMLPHRTPSCNMLRLIHMYPATDPAKANVDHLLLTIISYDCFH